MVMCGCVRVECYYVFSNHGQQQPTAYHKLSSIIGVPRAYVDQYYNELKEITRPVSVLVYGRRTAFTFLYILDQVLYYYVRLYNLSCITHVSYYSWAAVVCRIETPVITDETNEQSLQ